MRKIRLCAVQFKVSPDFSINLKKVESFFKNANKRNCNIICFPEIFLTGALNRKTYDDKLTIEFKKIFSELSENYSIYSIMGSIIERVDNNFFNISYLFDDNGNIMGNYKKNHLVQNQESDYITSGNQIDVFKTKIGNIGIQICRDLLYPEITRKLMLKGAEIVFCPSYWCSSSSSYNWIYNNKYFKSRMPKEVDSLVSSRAIESETIFVYVNAAGVFKAKGDNDVLLGRSQIALPFYGTIHILKHNKEETLIKEVDLNIVKDAKKVYKIEKDLKDYYG